MFIHLDPVGVFQLFCIVQGLTTVAYLLGSRLRIAVRRWLGLLLLAMILQVVDYFLSRSGVYFRHRWLYFTPLFFSWGFGPLLYAYVRALTPPAAPLRWLHWLPVGGQALFYLVLAGQDFDTKTWFWVTVHKPVTRYVEYYGAWLSLLTYAQLALRRLRATAALVPRTLPLWLRGLTGFGMVAAIDPLLNSHYLPVGAPLFYLSSLGLPVLTYGLVLLSEQRKASAIKPPTDELIVASTQLAEEPAESLTEYKPSVVMEAIDPAQLAKVVRSLQEESLYRDPDLTLDLLAQHVGLSQNTVSQLLNAGLGQSFYETVNGYRLAEVKRRLLTDDARRFTVLALAFDAGFNSKATFNRIFKEKTGLTPSEYRKTSQLTE